MSLVELPALFARAPCPPLPPPPPEQKRKQRLTVSLSAFSLRSLSCGSSRSPLWAELRVFCRPSMERPRGGGSARERLLRENGRRKKLPLAQAPRREDRSSVVAHRTWDLEKEDGVGRT